MAGGSRRAALRAAARQRLRQGEEPRPPAASPQRVEGGHVVRQVTGSDPARGSGLLSGSSRDKAYRCPGCDQLLPPGQAHVVAWPHGRPDDRRHWHTACWAARARRGVNLQRGRNAPRY